MFSYDTLSEAITDLRKRGYEEDFNLKSFCIECPSLQIQLKPEEFSITETYRFEGMSNPDDSSVVYAIESDNGIKGILVDAYGMYSESMTTDMAKKIQMA